MRKLNAYEVGGGTPDTASVNKKIRLDAVKQETTRSRGECRLSVVLTLILRILQEGKVPCVCCGTIAINLTLKVFSHSVA